MVDGGKHRERGVRFRLIPIGHGIVVVRAVIGVAIAIMIPIALRLHVLDDYQMGRLTTFTGAPRILSDGLPKVATAASRETPLAPGVR